MFDDWRRGMEAFGKANAIVAPPRKWNSGDAISDGIAGGYGRKVNYEGAIDVADFIKS